MTKQGTNTEVAPVQAGDKVGFTSRSCFSPFQMNWNVSVYDVGVVESVRRVDAASYRYQAYVMINGNLWLVPVTWLKKVEVK